MDPTWEPAPDEEKTIFGLKLKQRRNDAKITADTFKNIVTKNKDVSDPKFQGNWCLLS